jgi:ABC-type branched-subunit amino acid transport system permease subunit
METFVLYALLGIGAGAVYSILACGLVVIYKGSGVVNFAQAAIAIFAGFVYVQLRNDHMSIAPAILVTTLACAAGGAVFSYGVMRPLRNAPILARVVATLGLFIALLSLIPLIWSTLGSGLTNPPSMFPTKLVFMLGGFIPQDKFWLAGVGILLTFVLWALYRFTTFGRATRAVAENERGAALVGFSPDLIATGNWALGSGLAGLAGVLLVPTTGLDLDNAFLIVPVLAAALLGRFTSFWLVTASAFLLGSLQSLVGYYWNTQPGVTSGLPFLAVILAIIATGKRIPSRGMLETGTRLAFAPRSKIHIVAAVLLAGVLVLMLLTLDRTYQVGIQTSLVTALIALSLVIVTGWVGQISLAQVAFAGVGAYATVLFASKWSVPFPLPILLAGLLAVPVGILIGLPALRVRGINLAIVTLGASVALSAMVFQHPSLTNGGTGNAVPSPKIGGLSLDPISHPAAFGIFALVVLALVVVAMSNIRRSASGRRMLAVRANERAAAAAGVNVAATKLTAFALSAFVGACGGSLLAYQQTVVSYEPFVPSASLTLLTIVYIGSIAAVSGGVLAGFIASGGLLFVFLSHLGLNGTTWWTFVSAVGLILTVMFLPDGVAVFEMRRWKKVWLQVRARMASRPQAAEDRRS